MKRAKPPPRSGRRRRRGFELCERNIKIAIAKGEMPFTSDVPAVRRLRSLIDRYVAHLGGESEVTHPERMLLNRASMLCLLCESIERRLIERDLRLTANDASAYVRFVLALYRIADRLGLPRRPKEVEDLQTYLARAYPEQDDVIDAQPVNEPEPAEVVE